MNLLIELINNIYNSDLFNILLGLMTIAGTLFGIISVRDAKKSQKELATFKYLFNIAEKNIDKQLTQEEINRLHEEKQSLKQTRDDLEALIKREIPRQARRTVLYDKLKADEEYLSLSYNRYITTKQEYEEIEQEVDIQIPGPIMDEIELHIMPDYLIKQKKEKYMSMLTTISYATAFLSILPGLGVLSRYSIILTIYPLLRIATLNMPKDKVQRKKYIIRLFYNTVLVLLLIVNIFSALLLYDGDWRTVSTVQPILLVSVPIFLLMLIPKTISLLRSISRKTQH